MPYALGESAILDWFAGGAHHSYMTLVHCMGHDWLWIGVTVALDLAVASGYLVIARHWWSNQRTLAPGPARKALGSMRNIFVFCGICGYIFIPIKMFWPAWRLYDMFMLVLAWLTWRYAWSARELKVLYSELGRNERLSLDLEASRAESRRKSFFLNAISHDLRTPLNGLALQAELARMSCDSKDPQSLRQALCEIEASTAAASGLLNNLMELGRLDWGEDPMAVSDVPLRQCLERIITVHRRAAEQRGIHIRLNIPDGMVVRTDRLKLERIADNLLSNAVRFTHEGGVTIHARQLKDDIYVDFTDTGIGISEEHRPHLFDEFYQVGNGERDPSKGFGLGLAIARRLAEQLDGELAVDSEPGRGSRFTFRLHGAAVVSRPVPGAGQPVAAG